MAGLWRFVQDTGAGTAGNGISLEINGTTAGNVLVVGLEFITTSTAPSISEFGITITGTGNTISQTPDASAITSTALCAIYSTSLVTGGSVTIAIGTAALVGDFALNLFEYSNGAAPYFVMSPISGVGASGNGNIGTITPTANALLLAAYTTTTNPFTQTAGSGWTLVSTFAGNGSIPSNLFQEVLNTSSPIVAVPGTAFTGEWLGVAASYQTSNPPPANDSTVWMPPQATYRGPATNWAGPQAIWSPPQNTRSA
jgi:hypothetical protein